MVQLAFKQFIRSSCGTNIVPRGSLIIMQVYTSKCLQTWLHKYKRNDRIRLVRET